jgi:hypothetical protein
MVQEIDRGSQKGSQLGTAKDWLRESKSPRKMTYHLRKTERDSNVRGKGGLKEDKWRELEELKRRTNVEAQEGQGLLWIMKNLSYHPKKRFVF